MKYALLFIILFVFSAFTPPANNNSLVYQGIAKDIDTQELIYREIHKEIHDNTGHIATRTNFVDANNKLIAKRMLDFSKSKTKPHYSLNDYRTGLKEEVSYNKGVFTIIYQENSNSPLARKELSIPEPAIVDGGFNFYVKQEWNNLMQGRIAYFNFISTSRQSYYRFQLTKIDNPKNINNSTVVIKMEPANYFLRALLDPILISYNRTTKRIVDYKGISNIKNSNGDNHFALLSYPNVGP